MRVWLAYQNDMPIDLRGETLTLKVHVREIRPEHDILEELTNISKIISKYEI